MVSPARDFWVWYTRLFSLPPTARMTFLPVTLGITNTIRRQNESASSSDWLHSQSRSNVCLSFTVETPTHPGRAPNAVRAFKVHVSVTLRVMAMPILPPIGTGVYVLPPSSFLTKFRAVPCSAFCLELIWYCRFDSSSFDLPQFAKCIAWLFYIRLF